MPDEPAPAWTAPLSAWVAAHPLWATLAIGAVLLLVAWLAFSLTRRYLVALLGEWGRRTRFTFDEALHERNFFRRLAWAVPLLVVRTGLPYLPLLPDEVTVVVQRLIAAGMLLVIAGAIGAFVAAFGDEYAKRPQAAARPIKGYLQAIVLVVYVAIAIVVIATLIGRDPLLILSGLGAMTAVLLLVFKDTILGLVAGIQLTANDMVAIGDWIEMPKYSADGDVIDVALTHGQGAELGQDHHHHPDLRADHRARFKNWRGMQETGGRRIKRAVYIDMNTHPLLRRGDARDASPRFAVLPRLHRRARARRWTEYNAAQGSTIDRWSTAAG